MVDQSHMAGLVSQIVNGWPKQGTVVQNVHIRDQQSLWNIEYRSFSYAHFLWSDAHIYTTHTCTHTHTHTHTHYTCTHTHTHSQ